MSRPPPAIRITYLISTLERSGPVNVLHSLIKHLPRDALQPSIVTLSPEPKSSRWDDFAALGVELYSANRSRTAIDQTRTVGEVHRILNRIDPDIVHSHCLRSDLISSLIGRRSVRLNTIHNDPFIDNHFRFGGVYGWAVARAHLLICRRMRVSVLLGDQIEKKLQAKGLKRTQVILNGVDRTGCVADSGFAAVQEIRKTYGGDGKTIIVSTGNLNSRKDPITLMQAVRTLHQGGRNFHLIVLGDGPLAPQVKQLACDLQGSVTVLGHVPDVSTFLAASDVFVSASLGEGMPMAVLEAAASGLRLCLSDIPPHREIVSRLSEKSTMFACGNAAQLEASLAALIDDRGAEGDRSRRMLEFAATPFTAEAMAAAYSDLYRTKLQ